MSDVTEQLDWDSVLGAVEEQEKQDKSEGKGDFEAIPKGPYNVVVQEADKKTSGAGNEMIKVRVQVTDGPYAKRVLFTHIVFVKGKPNAMRMTLAKLAAFGISREIIGTTKPSIAEIADMLVGLQAIAVVGIQEEGEYKGSNEIKTFKPLEGAPQPVPQVAASKPAGVPHIPTPQPAAAAAPVIPTPDVPVGPADAADPFEG